MSTLTASPIGQTQCKQQCRKCTNESRVSPDAIRKRAYDIFLTRRDTGGPGDPISDWLQAELELHALTRGEILLKGNQEC